MKRAVFLLFTLFSVAAVSAQQSGVPVRVGVVQQQDVPVWLRGLGQVKAKQSVEIRSQVDGLLQQLLVEEGQMVKQGDLLAVLDDRTILAAHAQAKAQYQVVQAQLEVARLDLKRYQALGKTQAIARQNLEQQQALVAQLEAQLQSVQASIHAQDVQLSFTRIHSPVSGLVGIRNVDVGNYVRPSDAQGLFSVVQLDPISVEMAVPQQLLPKLQRLMVVAQQKPVPVQAFGLDGSQLLAEGQLKVLDNRVSSSGTVRIKADFANADHQLWPEQSLTLAVRQERLTGAVTVPGKALQQGPDGPYVWLNDAGKAKIQPVTLVLKERDLVVVQGVTPGQQVVVDGQSRLKAGAALAIQSAESAVAESKQ